jgi:tRNA threonylcarbamoyladenosine biosynthesis protein TsaE
MEEMNLNSVGETLALGERIGRTVAAGGVIALCGGLGAGKTHLTKGIAAGLGADGEAVSSPTFSLVQEYRGGRLPVFHFDFYRLDSAEEVLAIGWDEYVEAGGVCVVEWADLFPSLLPAGTQWWRLELSPDGARRAWMETGPVKKKQSDFC